MSVTSLTHLKEPVVDKGEMQEMYSPHFGVFFSPLSDPQNSSQSNVSGGAWVHLEVGTGNVRRGHLENKWNKIVFS